VKNLRIPKHVLKVIDHYNECFLKADRCLHCNDCIAFALLLSEHLNLWLPPPGVPYIVGGTGQWIFVKFLVSSISADYLPCKYGRALSRQDVKRFAWALLRLPLQARQRIRSALMAHDEFHGDAEMILRDSVKVFRVSDRDRLKRRVLGVNYD